MSKEKKKLVMVFGTFDYLHAGHENLFSQAKNLGDEIIAIVARDKTVQAIKGETADNNEKDRTKNLIDTGWATKVLLGDAKNKTKMIKTYRPDVIALGYDQFAFTYGLEKLIIDLKLDAQIKRLMPYRPDMYKSSIIKRNKKNEEEVAQETKLVYNLSKAN